MEQIQQLRRLIQWTLALCAVPLLGLAVPAGAQTIEEVFIPKVRAVQDKMSAAYAATDVMDEYAMNMSLAAIDDAMVLMREVAQYKIDDQLSDAAFDEMQKRKGRIYEEIIRGDRNDGFSGSLARLIWSLMIHHGIDNVNTYDGKVTSYNWFVGPFVEVFNDARSLFGKKRGKPADAVEGSDGSGRREARARGLWWVLDRRNRERMARNAIVRLFDMHEYINQFEKSDLLFDVVLHDYLEVTSGEAQAMRVERKSAEIMAMALFAATIGMNAVGPYFAPVPGVTQFDWVGWVSDGIWGSSLLSSVSYVMLHGSLLVSKLSTNTFKTSRMIDELMRVFADPAELAKKIKAGDKSAEQVLERVKAERKKFIDEVRAGKHALGRHRAKMMNRGYDPATVGAVPCASYLTQLFK